MRLRTAAGFAALLLALTAGPSQAAPFRFRDAVGDGVAKQSAMDIAWVELRTTGTGKGAQYVPWDLAVTMRLNNVPLTTPGVRYVVEAEVQGCGRMRVTYAPPENSTGVMLSAGRFDGYCDPADAGVTDVRFERQGASLTWRVPLSKLPQGMGLGAVYTEIRAYVELGDPFVGSGADFGIEQLADVATAPQDWVVR